jgi:hypothetical protein
MVVMATVMVGVAVMVTAMVAATTAQQSTKRRQRWQQQMRSRWRMVKGASLHKTVEVFTKENIEPTIDNTLVKLMPLFIW